MKSIVMIYGTVGGNTQMTVELIANFLTQNQLKVVVKRADQSTTDDVIKSEMLILASPTYGHGSLEVTMHQFLEKIKGVDLTGKPCAVVGLGDPHYDIQYHLESAPILEKFLIKAGGKLLLPALKLSRSPVIHVKGFISAWSEKLIAILKTEKS